MNKNEKKYNIIKAASLYTIGNILVKGVSFFVLPIFTSLMSTMEYGIYAIYTSYLTIFEVVILLGLSSTVRIAKFDKDTNFEKYMSTIVLIPVIATMLVLLLLNIYFLIFNNNELLSMDQTLWNYLLITSAFSAVATIIGARLVIDAKYHEYMAYSAINTLLNIVVSLLLCYTIYKNHNIHMARVIGQCVANLASTVFLIFITKINLNFDKQYFKQAMVWGIPLLFHTLATVVLTQSDRIVIKYINGYSATGIYSIAITLITIPLTFHTSFENAWAPWFYKKMEENDYVNIRKVNNLYIMIFGIITAGFMLVSPEIIYIFTNKDYWDSIYCLVPLSISVFGEMLYCLPANVEYYNKKTIYIMWGTICATVINIGLDIGFVFIFDFVGAAYATVISKLLLFLFHYILSRRINPNAVFDNGVAILTIIVLFGINFVTIGTVDLIILRFGICVLIAIIFVAIGIKNKGVVKQFIKK